MRRNQIGSALLAGALLAPMGAAQAGRLDPEVTALKAAVTSFKDAGEVQDVAAAGEVLHADFRVLFSWTHESGVTILDRAGYLGLLGSKKIGGTEGALTFGAVSVRDELAQAAATIQRSDARFDSTFTLIKGEGGWQIVQEATVVQAAPAK